MLLQPTTAHPKKKHTIRLPKGITYSFGQQQEIAQFLLPFKMRASICEFILVRERKFKGLPQSAYVGWNENKIRCERIMWIVNANEAYGQNTDTQTEQQWDWKQVACTKSKLICNAINPQQSSCHTMFLNKCAWKAKWFNLCQFETHSNKTLFKWLYWAYEFTLSLSINYSAAGKGSTVARIFKWIFPL